MALLIKAEELKGLISLEEAIDAVKCGFRDQGEKPAYSAPRIRMQHEDRRVTVHPGGCHRLGVAGMFIHVERYTFHGGAQQYERAGKRVYVAYDSESAELKTIVIGSLPLFAFDSEADMFGTETAITSAVGTDMLAREDCRVLGLYGTGRQARRHLVAMCAIRPTIETVRVFSRSEENRRRFAEEMQGFVRAKIEATSKPEEVARGADLICCATGSNVPVLFGAWLESGQHVTSIVAGNKGVVTQGSVPRPRREFDDEVIARADRIVATLREQAIVDEQGDLFEPVKKGITSWDKIAELGELAAGKAHGRRGADEITVFKQNSDQGVGFMALAKLAYDKARAHGLGMDV